MTSSEKLLKRHSSWSSSQKYFSFNHHFCGWKIFKFQRFSLESIRYWFICLQTFSIHVFFFFFPSSWYIHQQHFKLRLQTIVIARETPAHNLCSFVAALDHLFRFPSKDRTLFWWALHSLYEWSVLNRGISAPFNTHISVKMFLM